MATINGKDIPVIDAKVITTIKIRKQGLFIRMKRNGKP